jgi:hypothetical protein
MSWRFLVLSCVQSSRQARSFSVHYRTTHMLDTSTHSCVGACIKVLPLYRTFIRKDCWLMSDDVTTRLHSLPFAQPEPQTADSCRVVDLNLRINLVSISPRCCPRTYIYVYVHHAAPAPCPSLWADDWVVSSAGCQAEYVGYAPLFVEPLSSFSSSSSSDQPTPFDLFPSNTDQKTAKKTVVCF